MATQGKARLGGGLIIGACRTKADASDHPDGVDRQQQMDTLIPAQPVAPAHIGQVRQPARATALGIPRGDAGAVQGFIEALWCR